MTIAPIYFPLALELAHPEKFNRENALSLAIASQLAYDEPSPNIVGELTDTQALFLDAGDAYVLAIRGTKPNALLAKHYGWRGWLRALWLAVRDFLTDADVRRVEVGPGAKVHRGFHEATNDILPQVLAATRSLPKPLFVCGHSLGASVSHRIVRALSIAGVPVHAVYAIACPNSCNRREKRNYNLSPAAGDYKLGEVTWNIWNEEDIVCRIPLLLTKGGHNYMFLSDGLNTLTDPNILSRIASDIYGLWKSWGQGQEDLLTDHFLVHYLEKLKL